jgi:RND family efflux transporter MFP subunit
MKIITPRSIVWLSTCALAVGSLIAGCGPNAASTKRTAPTPVVVPIRCIELETIDFAEFIGKTEATKTVEVRARVSGFIKEVLFTEGADVKKGDLLFKIEPDQYQAVLAQSDSRITLLDAQLELAQTKLARAKKLIDVNAISREEYDEDVAAVKEANAKIAAAKADRVIAQLDVNYTDVKAEIDGRIDRAFITEGNVVSGGLVNGTLLTRIVENNPMFVFFDVDERALLEYQRLLATRDPSSQEPKMADNAYPCYMQLQDEQSFSRKGTLNFIENRADGATGTIRVRAQFDNQDNVLTGGLFVRIRIPKTLQPYKAIVIPEQAIITDQTAKSVMVVNADKKAERRPITIGTQKGELRVVTSGLQPGESIILDGIQKVRVNETVEYKSGWEELEKTFYDRAKAAQPALDSAPASTNLPGTTNAVPPAATPTSN